MALLIFILFFFQIPFGSDVLSSLHVFHLLYRGNQHRSIKSLLYYFILKRHNWVVKPLFIVCLILLGGTTTSWNPSKNICCGTSVQTFIYLTIFHSVSIFNNFILSVRVMILHAILNLHVWSILIPVLVSDLFGCSIWILHWL